MSRTKRTQLFDETKYKNPYEALDKASAKEWASACEDVLWTVLNSRPGGVQAFLSEGFDAFVPVARREYHGHGFQQKHIRTIFDGIAIRAGGTHARI